MLAQNPGSTHVVVYDWLTRYSVILLSAVPAVLPVSGQPQSEGMLVILSLVSSLYSMRK